MSDRPTREWADMMLKQADEGRERIAELEAEVEQLRCIVPTTKDGVQVKHGDKIWFPGDDEPGTVTFHVCGEGGFDAIGRCYSTREAAEAAKGGE